MDSSLNTIQKQLKAIKLKKFFKTRDESDHEKGIGF